jgi:hypothetical protein
MLCLGRYGDKLRKAFKLVATCKPLSCVPKYVEVMDDKLQACRIRSTLLQTTKVHRRSGYIALSILHPRR